MIPTLSQGGAEKLLASLIEATSPRLEHCIVVMFDKVFFEPKGARIVSLGLPERMGPQFLLALPGALKKLRAIIRSEQPDIVHGWLYYGNLLASAAKGIAPILWSIHNTTFHRQTTGRKLYIVDWLCARLSPRIPRRIVYCAESARTLHEGRGYDPRRSVTILNAIDTTRFCFDESLRKIGRQRLALVDNVLAIGHFARFDPQKNFGFVLEAIALARAELPAFTVIMAGRDVTDDNLALRALIAAHGLTDVVRLNGPLDDMDAALSAMDIVVLGSSYGEALPMIAIEALACQRPLVATAIGDMPALGLPDENLIAAGDVAGFARAIVHTARAATAGQSAEWLQLATGIRARFDLAACAAAYEACYREASSTPPESAR